MSSNPISGPCTQGPRAFHDSGPRRASAIRWVVLHSAEASDDAGVDTTAEGVARFFASPAAMASTHLAVDRDSCVRMLPDLVIPWGATGANTAGLHVELCGRAGWTSSEWLGRPRLLERAAYKVAVWCFHYELPVRFRTAAGLRLRRPGITTHAEVNRAFHGGDHWDPGPNFPRDHFLELVREHVAELERAAAERRKRDKAAGL